MSAVTTTYQVRTLYTLDDKASKALDSIAGSATRAAEQTDHLGRGLRLLAGAFVGRAAFGAAKRALVDFNNEVEKMQVGLSSVIHLNLGGSFKDAQAAGHRLFEQFQTDAKQSIGTTKEFADFATDIAASVFQAGGSMKELRAITKGAITGATVFGERADLASLDIQQFLGGTLSTRDRFAKKLLGGTGISHTDVNKLSVEKRRELLLRLLQSETIKQAAKQYENSFAGVTSTFQDNIEIALGQVGKPLVDAITQEIKGWNKWIAENQETIKAWADDLKEGLVTGFKFAKHIAKFFLDNREIIKLLLTMKTAGMASAAASNFITGMSSSAAAFTAEMDKGKASFGDVAKKMTSLASTIGLAILAFDSVLNWVLDRNIEKKMRATEFGFTKGSAGRVSAGMAAQTALLALQKRGLATGVKLDASKALGQDLTALYEKGVDIGAIKRTTGEFNRGVAERALIKSGDLLPSDSAERLRKELAHETARGDKAQMQFIGGKLAKHEAGLALLDALALAAGVKHEDLGRADKATEMENKRSSAKTPVKVEVKIDVTTNDPDRFVMDVNDLLEDAIRNPTSARRSPRGM